MSREAMKLALDALVFAAYEDIEYDDACDQKVREARNALRQALEEKQEPVAWISEGGDVSRSKRYMDEMGFKCNPLYTSPPASKPWVGLTDDEVDECYYWKDRLWTTDELVRHVEAKLKEKNT